jgi:uncharacterized membrane protein
MVFVTGRNHGTGKGIKLTGGDHLQKLRKQVRWALVALSAVGVAAAAAAPYLRFDPAASRVVLQPSFPLHFPLLLVHIFSSVIALVTGPVQFLDRLRLRRPTLHKIIGRLYLGGVLIGGSTGLVIGLYTDSFIRQIAFLTLAVLWLFTGWKAYRTVRQRRFADHRLWMIRNYAMTMVAVTARIAVPLLILVLFLRGDATADNLRELMPEAIGVGVWLGLVVNLALAEWVIASGGKSEKVDIGQQ